MNFIRGLKKTRQRDRASEWTEMVFMQKMKLIFGIKNRGLVWQNVVAFLREIPASLRKKDGTIRGKRCLEFIQNLKTGQKIIALIMIMAVFLSAVGVVGYYYTGKMSQQIQQIAANNLLSVKWLNEIRVYTGATEAAITRVVNPLTIDKFFIDEKIAEIKKRDESIEKLLANYQQLTLSPFEKERVSVLELELGSYRTEVQKVVDLILAGRKSEGYSSFTQNAKPHLDAANALLMELSEYSSRQAEETSRQNQKEAVIARSTVVVTSLLAIILAVLLGLLLSRFTARRLATVEMALNEVSRGNLQCNELEIAASDDIGTIAQDVNKMVVNLRTIVNQVAESAEQVAASSEELTANAEQSAQTVSQVASVISEVAGSAQEQLQAVDQTSITINQMTAKLQQIAANANGLAAVSDESAEAAQAGNEAVEKAVTQIIRVEKTVAETAEVVVRLGERSKDIGSIVSTISQIASQTNLLSLNAAIEAARAGEHGRGFSVVADEVGKLAAQSQQAVKQIAVLLSEIRVDTDRAVAAMDTGTHEVKVGAKVVGVAGESFKAIALLVNDVSSQVREFSREIQETANESHKIVDAISNIEVSSKEIAAQTETVSAATEEQSAAMEEITLSSQNLSQMAEELQHAIKLFKV
ncbi:MAG: methyl-accepting chemotaxis protein [Negativicutes bacterium]|nr:methyl-accepting chemotaxis protein [Negativicutes bacterium]